MSEIRTSQPVVPGASYVIMKGTSISGSRTQRHIQYVNYILVSELQEKVSGIMGILGIHSQEPILPRNGIMGRVQLQKGQEYRTRVRGCSGNDESCPRNDPVVSEDRHIVPWVRYMMPSIRTHSGI